MVLKEEFYLTLLRLITTLSIKTKTHFRPNYFIL